MPVVGPGLNFPIANSVADDFSLPQLTNALGQDIIIVANLTGPNCGPNNAPTTCTIDTALSRQVVTAPFASTVSKPSEGYAKGWREEDTECETTAISIKLQPWFE